MLSGVSGTWASGVTRAGLFHTAKNYPLNVGGVSGGAYSDATGASCSNVTDCVNNGPINYATYCKGTRPTCGGIVGYPGYENETQTNLITRCVNNGEIKIVAFDKIRAGGINGGAGNVTYCKNYGTIEGHIQQVDGLIGGISGFHTYGHKFEYNESYGTLSNDLGSYTGGTVELGGLIGQHGNYDSYAGEGRGCIVNCDITYGWSNAKWFGITIGWYDGSKTVVLGTEDEPIKVLGGSMTYAGNTIEITADNYETYLKGSGSKTYTVHAKFGE